jgi:hypothetical protein
MRIIFWL